jgi:hypothetical protein
MQSAMTGTHLLWDNNSTRVDVGNETRCTSSMSCSGIGNGVQLS